MANPPAPSWELHCPWCDWYLHVGARGAHGHDPGAGVEAANRMERHAREAHAKTWDEFLAEGVDAVA